MKIKIILILIFSISANEAICNRNPLSITNLGVDLVNATNKVDSATRNNFNLNFSVLQTESGPEGLLAGDFNSDGMNDIAVANWKADCISVFLQNGNNFNFSKNNYQTGTNPKLVLGCDIENDLDIDFVVVCEGDSRIDILLNNGHGLFSSHSNYNLDSQIASVVIEDFNSDGFGDMALTCGIGYNNYNPDLDDPMLLKIFINDKHGNFDETSTQVIGIYNRFNKYISLNQTVSKYGFELKSILIPYDNVLNLRTTSTDTMHSMSIPSLNMYQTFPVGVQRIIEFQALNIIDHPFFCTMPAHHEDGTFQIRKTLAMNNVVASDIDKDGDNDIIVTSWAFPSFMGNGTLFIYLNDGQGELTLQNNYVTGVGPYNVFADDLTNDSFDDLIVSNYFSNTLTFYKNNGGSFLSTGTYECPKLPYSVFTSDFDNDGLNDILSIIPNKDSAAVFLNIGEGLFSDYFLIPTGKSPWEGTSIDFDRDGTLDLAFSSYTENQIKILHSLSGPSATVNLKSVFQREDGSAFVDIYFDLNGSENLYDINLEISFDGGISYTQIPTAFLSGDIGLQTPGNNKHIIWDGLSSFPNIYSTSGKLKIIVNPN